MISKLAVYIFSAMVHFAPLSNHAYNENPTITKARYESIAQDIADGVKGQSVFNNDPNDMKMALLLVSISVEESGQFRADVDKCLTGGDHNTSWTIFQLTNSYAPKYIVCHDRRKAVNYAIKAIKESFNACRYLNFKSRLSIYDTGHCIRNESISVRRINRTLNYFAAHPTL